MLINVNLCPALMSLPSGSMSECIWGAGNVPCVTPSPDAAQLEEAPWGHSGGDPFGGDR